MLLTLGSWRSKSLNNWFEVSCSPSHCPNPRYNMASVIDLKWNWFHPFPTWYHRIESLDHFHHQFNFSVCVYVCASLNSFHFGLFDISCTIFLRHLWRSNFAILQLIRNNWSHQNNHKSMIAKWSQHIELLALILTTKTITQRTINHNITCGCTEIVVFVNSLTRHFYSFRSSYI